MNCDAVQDLLLDHAEGCLESHQSAAVEEHLRGCSPCRLALQQTRELVGAMGDIRHGQESASKASRAGAIHLDLTTWQPGSRLGDFEIIGELGRGGMGVVYRARQISLNRLVALKVLPASIRQFPSAISRFKKEAQAAAKLHHTNIVPVYSQGEHEGHFYYAMELIEGEGLDSYLKSGKGDALELLTSRAGHESQSAISGRRNHYRFVARLIAGVADGLEHAHQQGVVHRDIKPQNLLLARDGQLHITDFGLARLLDEPSITMTGEMVGTPAYMSPEQVAGDRHAIDHRTDIYSLGVTFYELLTGERPFDGVGRDQVIAKIMTREPKAPRKINPQVPLDLETICLRAMEKEPGRRYASAEAMAADLRRYADDREILIRRAGPVERAIKWIRRHPALATIYALSFLLLIGGAMWSLQTIRARHARADELVQQAYNVLTIEDYHESQRALASLKEAERLGPDQWSYRRALGLAYLATDTDRAIENLRWCVAQRPNDTTTMYILAWALRLQAGRLDSATDALLEKANAMGGPSSSDGYFFRGMVLVRETPLAEQDFRDARDKRENYAQADLHLGRAMNHWMYHNRKHDKFDDIKRSLTSAALMQKSRAYPRYLLSLAHRISGEIYRDAGNSVEAGREFQSALDYALDAQTAELANPRGYVAESEYWEAIREYPKALAARNKSEPYCAEYERRVELHQYRWRLEYWLGEYDKAMQDLTALAKLRDQSDPMRIWYVGLFPSLIAAEQGRMNDAVGLALKMAENQPTSFRAVTSAACMLQILGQRGQAERLLDAHRDRINFMPGPASEISSEWMRATYDQCQTRKPLASLEKLAGSQKADKIVWAVPQFFAAAQALGELDRQAALAHFQSCEATYDWDDYCYAARIFARRMEKDSHWPSWQTGKDDLNGISRK